MHHTERTAALLDAQRQRALRQAYTHGLNRHLAYCRERTKSYVGTEHEGYEPASLTRLNAALDAFNQSTATPAEMEGMLRALWLYAVHSWAEDRWRFYVAGLIGMSGEL